MKCPNCGGQMFDLEDGNLQCDSRHGADSCGLAGPRGLIEKLARKLAFTAHVWLEDRIADLETQLEAERDRRIEAERPAAVLAEAERLLRAANVADVYLRDGQLYTRDDVRSHGASGTLAEAYEKLKGGRDG